MLLLLLESDDSDDSEVLDALLADVLVDDGLVDDALEMLLSEDGELDDEDSDDGELDDSELDELKLLEENSDMLESELLGLEEDDENSRLEGELLLLVPTLEELLVPTLDGLLEEDDDVPTLDKLLDELDEGELLLLTGSDVVCSITSFGSCVVPVTSADEKCRYSLFVGSVPATVRSEQRISRRIPSPAAAVSIAVRRDGSLVSAL